MRLKNSDPKRYYSAQALLSCLTVTANIPLFVVMLCCWSFLVYLWVSTSTPFSHAIPSSHFVGESFSCSLGHFQGHHALIQALGTSHNSWRLKIDSEVCWQILDLPHNAGCGKAPVPLGLVDTHHYFMLCKMLSTLLRKQILTVGLAHVPIWSHHCPLHSLLH